MTTEASDTRRDAGIDAAVILVDDLGRGVRPAGPEDTPAFTMVDGEPAISRLLGHLVASGIREFCLIVHQVPGLVAHFFGDGNRLGVRITYIYHQRPLGSGGAVAQASDFVAGRTVLVAPGTIVTDLRLSDFAAHHRKTGGDVTVALTSAEDDAASRRQFVRVDRESKIVEYGRAEPLGGAEWRDTAVHLIEPAAIEELSGDARADWSRDVMPGLVAHGRAYGWESRSEFSIAVPSTHRK